MHFFERHVIEDLEKMGCDALNVSVFIVEFVVAIAPELPVSGVREDNNLIYFSPQY